MNTLSYLSKVFFLSLILVFISNIALADGHSCHAPSGKVVSIMPWGDGATFINLDQSNDCGCSISTRFGFYPDNPHAKTFLAQALVAFANNRSVTIWGKSGCTVHTNTAELYTIILGE